MHAHSLLSIGRLYDNDQCLMITTHVISASGWRNPADSLSNTAGHDRYGHSACIGTVYNIQLCSTGSHLANERTNQVLCEIFQAADNVFTRDIFQELTSQFLDLVRSF